MENEEEKVEVKKKGRNGLFTLFACVMTAIIVVLAMNIGDKLEKIVEGNKSSNSTSNSNETSNSNKTETNENEMVSALIFDGNKMIDTTKDINVVVNRDGNSKNTVEISYKGKLIMYIPNDIPESINQVFLVGDLIMIELVSSDGSGTIYFIDLNGNEVYKTSGVKGNKNYFVIAGGDKASVSKDTITFTTSIYNYDKDNCKEVYSQYELKDSDLATATYEFKYLGNNKFSELKVVNSTTVAEFCK